MKALPPVFASAINQGGLLVEEFACAEHVPNRGAVDFIVRLRSAPNDTSRSLAVSFSGTVMVVRAEAFGLPSFGDRQATFRTFAEAAIGDELDARGAMELGEPGGYITVIDCFSPHFQAWR